MTETDNFPPARPPAQTPSHVVGSGLCRHLLRRIQELGVPYGHEESFKLTHQQVTLDRILIGLHSTSLTPRMLFDIASELGMPSSCRELLASHLPQANVVLFGIEDRAGGSVCKLYLEFWDQVCREVRRTGAQTPLLLHLGVKWDSNRPDHHEVARYTCFPLLSSADALRRMTRVYPQNPAAMNCEMACAIVRKSLKRNPTASLLYLEVSEGDNPRCSFDINLYKTGLRVLEAAPELRQAAAQFGLAEEAMDSQLQRLGHCHLGHLSGGTDRHGGEFLSVYAEIQPL
jgi:hypothetical protein